MNPRRALILSLALLFILLPGCFLAAADDDAHTKIGDKMPAFTVESASGQPFSLTAHSGQVLVVNFWATWCEPCQAEMPELEQLVWQKYKSTPGFAFIAIAREQDKETVLYFHKRHPNLTFPLAWDPDRAVYRRFATQGIPRTYVVNRHGIIVYQSVGYAPSAVDEVDHAVQKALAEQ